jgi:glycosyltransferase involved in cell wall biosynthesis
MRVAIGANFSDRPMGGGNQFAYGLAMFLKGQGHEVTTDLACSDLDIILLIEPRNWLQISSFGPTEISRYIRTVNPNTLVVHRINECDERKQTRNVNAQIALANSVADCTVYISEWLHNLYAKSFSDQQKIVIRNAADRGIFRFCMKQTPARDEPFKIVTHHWSAHKRKGWDIYRAIDDSLGSKPEYEFHYIGNLPSSAQLKNIVLHPPCAGLELARKLSDAHVYLTASLDEPAGMHHIEGASVGLPIVYRESGALPEYCARFGESFFDISSVWSAIEKVRFNYLKYSIQMQKYLRGVDDMGQEYLRLFEQMLSDRRNIVQHRSSRGSITLANECALRGKLYGYYLAHKLGID